MAELRGDLAKKDAPTSFSIPEVDEKAALNDQVQHRDHAPLHHSRGLYVKEEERLKHHELTEKIDQQYTQEELEWKQKNFTEREKKIAEKHVEKDPKLSSVFSKPQ